MAEMRTTALKDIRKYLRRRREINVRISRALKRGDHELLLHAIAERKAVLERLKPLREELEHMNEGGKLTFEEEVIIREICQLNNSLIAQGGSYIDTIRRDMGSIEGKLQEIHKGKRVLSSYRGKRREGRGAVYIG